MVEHCFVFKFKVCKWLENECFHLCLGPRQVMHIECWAEVSKPGQQGALEAVRDSRGSWRKQREGNISGVKSNFPFGIMKLINQIKCKRDYLLYNMVCFQCDKAVLNTSLKWSVCYFFKCEHNDKRITWNKLDLLKMIKHKKQACLQEFKMCPFIWVSEVRPFT